MFVDQLVQFYYDVGVVLWVGGGLIDLCVGGVGDGGVQFGWGGQWYVGDYFVGGGVIDIVEVVGCVFDFFVVDLV